MKFTHLHTHSHYSLLDGLAKIDELIAKAKKCNMTALALTDHGVMYGIVEFYQKCKKAGIKPILGVEVYIASNGRHNKRAKVDEEKYHLVLLAKNDLGYKNLIKLTSIAHLEGFYYKPRVDWELLEQYHDGLIAMSACLGGEIPTLIKNGNLDKARGRIQKYCELFGEGNFYLELQQHKDFLIQKEVNQALINFSKELGVPIVASNDIHYVDYEDREAHDILLCLQTKKKITDTNRMSMMDFDVSFRSQEQMIEDFSHAPEAIENTQKIADQCNVELELGITQLPHYELPEGVTVESHLNKLCVQGLLSRYKISEGDVGSGKTVVVLMAMYNVFLNGYQSVMMAPTEILAKQHFNGFCKMLERFNVKIALITRTERVVNFKTPPANMAGRLNPPSDLAGIPLVRGEVSAFSGLPDVSNPDGESLAEIHKITKAKLLEIIESGEVNIVIGTHALLQENVKFKNLALAIIDEQHRFGVQQRKMLRDKSGDKMTMPHFLSMTATPIPRSLALTVYGDLDLSILDEMPVGRKKIMTKVVASENRVKAYDFIRNQIKDGKQTFVICPLIAPSDKMGFKSVTEEYKKLNEQIFKDLNIGILHGRMKSKEKDEVMRNFLNNEIQILVSTSVVEVGVDVPNASVMMIEGADHFGLAQLHQFRGRVGRSDCQSYCFLFSESNSQSSYERLRALERSNNGFELAEKDLQFRGPGQVYGIQQSGIPDLKIANLGDYDIIKLAKQEAEQLIQKDPSLSEWSILKDKIGEVVNKVHLE
ncbi:PHP domain-containing protein [Patescibacteria group bacterium]